MTQFVIFSSSRTHNKKNNKLHLLKKSVYTTKMLLHRLNQYETFHDTPKPSLRNFLQYVHLRGGTKEWKDGQPVWYRAPARLLQKNKDRYWYKGIIVSTKLKPAPPALQKKPVIGTKMLGLLVQNIDSKTVYWVPPFKGQLRARTDEIRPLMTDIDVTRLEGVHKLASKSERCLPHDEGFGDLHGLNHLGRAKEGKAFFNKVAHFQSIYATINPSLYMKLAHYLPATKEEEDRVERVKRLFETYAAAPARLFVDFDGEISTSTLHSSTKLRIRGHDGRHRMLAWKQFGCGPMPILLQVSTQLKQQIIEWTKLNRNTITLHVAGEINADNATLTTTSSRNHALLHLSYSPKDGLRATFEKDETQHATTFQTQKEDVKKNEWEFDSDSDSDLNASTSSSSSTGTSSISVVEISDSSEEDEDNKDKDDDKEDKEDDKEDKDDESVSPKKRVRKDVEEKVSPTEYVHPRVLLAQLSSSDEDDSSEEEGESSWAFTKGL